jgi:hypothetical protein
VAGGWEGGKQVVVPVRGRCDELEPEVMLFVKHFELVVQ